MYFVDRKKIEELIHYLDSCLRTFEDESFSSSVKDAFALERIAHMIIETIIDTGNKMIDGFIMRDPGSYEDIIEILEDETVVTSEEAAGLKKVILLRKELVQSYTNLDHQNIEKVLTEHLKELKVFPEKIQRYLTEELGPVSAFLPENQ
ncbi:DUF86 domain-containing protein [Alkalihalobacillus sp. AL-G]|uniref:DUF86 domain-containing protein n=1 Tax=Alkalihalobacillus sp. AL-G TaxID=2926399 RepID=UPI00272B5809|nr:DUF86 domain-containing protein [Alkalihalobacillus sp. AL-G]WLD92690.1 DUF86 domain-containing protein [Alkalihalobacillus sp. AL-G]